MTQHKVLYFSLGIYPGTPIRAAAEVRARQNLVALRELGYDILVLTPRDEQGRNGLGFPTVWLEPLPTWIFGEFLRRRDYRKKIQQVVSEHLTDSSMLLFCEHFFALACCPPHPRLVYSMHDLAVQTIRLRGSLRARPVTFKTRLFWRYLEWLEGRLIRKAQSVICVSASEAAKVNSRWHIATEYIPTVSAEAAAPLAAENLSGPARFWFYGSSGATANKVMLDHIADKIFDLIQVAIPGAEFHQVGQCDTYAPARIEWLQRHFTVHGFVENPANIFRRGDFCLIPYEHDTGFRTKLPELCGYGMIAAGYPATFACCPEMRDGYNCIIGANPAELVQKLAAAAADPTLRRKLTEGAIATRREAFSHAALLGRYRHALDFVK